jgi:hypothetical protein
MDKGSEIRLLATHFLAMVKLAMIQRCLRLLNPSDRTQPHDRWQTCSVFTFAASGE